MAVMATPEEKTEQADKGEGKKKRHLQPKFGFHVPADLWEAFCAHCDNQEPSVSYTAAGITAMKEYLVKRGAWPVQQPPVEDAE